MRYGNQKVSEGAVFAVLIMLLSMPVLMYVLMETIVDKIDPNVILTDKERANVGKKEGE